MKKLFALLLALVMMLSIVACVPETGNNTTGNAPTGSTGNDIVKFEGDYIWKKP